MKVRTVGVLAALGMLLSSVTVWSLTPPGDGLGAPEPAGGLRAAVAPLDVPPAEPVIRARFDAGSTLRVEGRLGHARMQAGRSNDTFVLATVQADAAAATSAAPVNLAIVIDRSGSMKGKRLENALAAARGMVARLSDGDVVSVIAYDTRAETLVQSTTIDERSRGRVTAALDGIVARGDTCISCALDAAMTALDSRRGMVNRVLLLTDGEPTQGLKDPAELRQQAGRARGMGASISTVGVDVDYNERVLSAIASESNGRHYFVENPGSLASIFDQERESLKQTVAKDAELVVTLADGVSVERVFDRSHRQEGRRLFVPLGSFSANEQKTLLVKLQVAPGAEGERAIADVSLAYRDLVGQKAGACEGQLAALMSSDPARVSQLDALVAVRLEKSETAATLTAANELFQRGQVDEAQRALETQLTRLKEERQRVAARAPAPSRDKVDFDFDDQLGALEAANSGFAQPAAPAAEPAAPGQFAAPPPPAKPAPATRKGKAQVRSNAERAVDFGF